MSGISPEAVRSSQMQVNAHALMHARTYTQKRMHAMQKDIQTRRNMD